MIMQPTRENLTVHVTGSYLNNHSFVLIDRRLDLVAIEYQEHLHRRMSDALIAVDERMIADECEPQNCGFLDKQRIKLCATKGHPGQGQG